MRIPVIRLTLRQILDEGWWDEYCEMTGTNPWCMNEGLASGDETVEIDLQAIIDAATAQARREAFEEAAKVAEACVAAAPTSTWTACQRSIAAAIRARGE